MFPSTLGYLIFYHEFNQSLDPNVFPSSLKVLYLGDDFDMPIDANVLPISLKKLVLSKKYAHPLPTILSGCTILTEELYSALPEAIWNNVFCSRFNFYVG
jgi:hypothetical protein